MKKIGFIIHKKTAHNYSYVKLGVERAANW